MSNSSFGLENRGHTGRENCECRTAINGLSPRKHDIPQPGLCTKSD